MNSSSQKIVVIGAGISGLVCAHRLKSSGADVVLIEKSLRPGGVIQSERIGDYLVERGPNSSRGTREMMDLIDELGISGEVVKGDSKAPSFIYFGGALHRVPMGPAGLIFTDVLSFGSKLRLLTEPLRRTRKPDGEESVESFFTRRLGPQLARRVVAAFVSGIYAGDARSLSIQAAFPGLAALERDYGGIIKGALSANTAGCKSGRSLYRWMQRYSVVGFSRWVAGRVGWFHPKVHGELFPRRTARIGSLRLRCGRNTGGIGVGISSAVVRGTRGAARPDPVSSAGRCVALV